MRALTMMAALVSGLLVSACYEHRDPVAPAPRPQAQADGPLMDRVPGEQGPVAFDHGGHMGYGFACTDCHHTVEAGRMPSQGCVGCHPAPSDGDPAHGGPDDNMLLVGDTQDTGVLPGVSFNHFTHGSAKGYKLACGSCHHTGENVACDTCHGDIAMQQGDQVVPRGKRAMHLQCKGCHESLVGNNPDSVAPVDCDVCHSQVSPERLEGALSLERAAHLMCVECHRDVQAERPAAPVNCRGCHVPAEDVQAAVEAAAAAAAAEAEALLAQAETCEGDDCPELPCEGDDCPEPEPTQGQAASEGEVAAAPAAPATGGPADVVWPGSMGTVTFRHSTHGTMGCDGCHPGMAPMASDKMGMEAGHGACSSCHPQVTGDCAKCHVQ